jgi:hypothetical protein
MYTEDTVSISKADDGGYVLHVQVKWKKSSDSKGEIACCGPNTERKVMVAKNTKEVNALLKKILPEMTAGGMEEDVFGETFKSAAKEA